MARMPRIIHPEDLEMPEDRWKGFAAGPPRLHAAGPREVLRIESGGWEGPWKEECWCRGSGGIMLREIKPVGMIIIVCLGQVCVQGCTSV